MRSIPWSVRSCADRLGILTASACALHCIAIPAFLMASTTTPAVLLGDESFHRTMVWIVVPCALVAFALGCWQHKDRRVLLFGTLGVVGLVLTATVLHDAIGEAGEKLATLASTAALMTAHVRNFRICRSASCNHDAG